jgi:hypothetical protein
LHAGFIEDADQVAAGTRKQPPIDAIATSSFRKTYEQKFFLSEPKPGSSLSPRLPAEQWLSEIEAGAATIDDIAVRAACSKRHVNMTISLTFLAPGLVKAAVEGRLPHGIGVARLFDAPVAWVRQHQMLGLAHYNGALFPSPVGTAMISKT